MQYVQSLHLNQFTRHIYHGTSDAFKHDNVALAIVEKVISENWINNLSIVESIEHVKRTIE